MTVARARSIRKLLPSEAGALRGHLARLTAEERLFRFMGSLDAESVRSHCERIDWLQTVVVGFFEAGVLRGSAEVQVADDRFPMSYELAIAVETAWQEHGVATQLLHRALVIARNRAARELRIYCFVDNHRIQNLARKFGARFLSRAGQADAAIRIAAPSYSSLCEEIINDGVGWLSFWLHPAAAAAAAATAPPMALLRAACAP
ncbi:MAG: GNAT family N-acetyltransferase [Steroidobacteraceae bacterium]